MRAWDKKNGVIHMDVLPIPDSYNWDSGKNYDSPIIVMLPLNGNYIFMQSTGLTDKNGVDLYKKDFCEDAVGRIWMIDYSVKLAAFVFIYQKNKHQRITYVDFLPSQLPLLYIGNEYEGLLEDK